MLILYVLVTCVGVAGLVWNVRRVGGVRPYLAVAVAPYSDRRALRAGLVPASALALFAVANGALLAAAPTALVVWLAVTVLVHERPPDSPADTTPHGA